MILHWEGFQVKIQVKNVPNWLTYCQNNPVNYVYETGKDFKMANIVRFVAWAVGAIFFYCAITLLYSVFVDSAIVKVIAYLLKITKLAFALATIGLTTTSCILL